jgi:hypothetical protein
MTNPAIIPDVVVMDLDMKFLPDETSAEYRRDFEAFIDHFCQMDDWLRAHPITIQWELGGLHFAPMNTAPDHPLVTSLMRRKAETGKAPAMRRRRHLRTVGRRLPRHRRICRHRLSGRERQGDRRKRDRLVRNEIARPPQASRRVARLHAARSMPTMPPG